MNFLWKGHKSPPSGISWAQDKRSRAARSAVFRENLKWWTKILLILTQLTWVSRVKKVIEQFYWLITFFGCYWGQSYLATLVTPQNCTNMLRNLPFVVQFAYFSTRPQKVLIFPSNIWAAFVIKSIFWLFFFQQLLCIFFFEKLKETFWKISGNLWKTLTRVIERE